MSDVIKQYSAAPHESLSEVEIVEHLFGFNLEMKMQAIDALTKDEKESAVSE